MEDVLARIVQDKKKELANAASRIPLSDLEAQAAAASPPRGFARALSAKVDQGGFGLIAEIKKASPSAGLIRPDFDPPALAAAYEKAGAACLSVLTDKKYFQGENAYLGLAREACKLPVLRKDFIIDPWQITESRSLSADCILLIMACLSDAQAQELEAAALSWGMDVLIEAHDETEFERALLLSSPLIGVNNRNLKTMTTDIGVTLRLAKLLPEDRVLVAESGLRAHGDLERLAECGARRFLIGETLMRQPDVYAATKAMLEG